MNHLTRSAITHLFSWAALIGALASLSIPTGAAPTLTTLYSFAKLSTTSPYGNSGGAIPFAALVQGNDGNFYGATNAGGTNSTGTIFKITPSGILTTIYNFSADGGDAMNSDGLRPSSSLVLAQDGNFYGTTQVGGIYGGGTAFKITPSGMLTTLVNFTGRSGTALGSQLFAALVQGSDGNFYGTTYEGGSSGTGTIFKMTPGGTLTTLHSFSATDGNKINGDGAYPYASLVQGTDGNFYGTTADGGRFGDGTVFKMTPSGTLTTLVNFDPAKGTYPLAALIQDTDGNFYGTTEDGGSYNDGTLFRVTPTGDLTTVLSFDNFNYSSGLSILVLGRDGNIYGTNQSGVNGFGSVFEVTPSGELFTLAIFSGNDGEMPLAGLVQGNDGNFYGTTEAGGANGTGTVFKITPPGTMASAILTSLSPMTVQAGNLPFVLTVTGTGFLPGVTADFNGTVLTPSFATFTNLTFNVPASLVATPGSFDVTITNPGAIASNTLPFTVTPGLTLTGVSPASVPAGSQPISITVTGTNFVNGCIVKWNEQPLPTFYLSPTKATATVLASFLATAGTVKITISNPHVYATRPVTLTVTTPPPAPTITGFSPASGPSGTTVVITGTNLTGTTIVGFMGKHAASFTVSSDGTQITTAVPSGAKTGPVAVLTNGVEAKSPTSFAVTS